jgi:hypothetical protein
MLNFGTPASSPYLYLGPNREDVCTLHDYLVGQHPQLGYRFVPLVSEPFRISCALDITFLRRDGVGSVWRSGDIDNRLKTLADALRFPRSVAELGGYTDPADGEDPFYCLLEDDSLITGVAVQTAALLEPPAPGSTGEHDVGLIISVTLKPIVATKFNLSFS